MNPPDIAVVVLAVGAAVTSLTNLAKMAGLASTPARTVVIALGSSFVFVGTYIFAPIAFTIGAAAILATTGAVGIHELGSRASDPGSS